MDTKLCAMSEFILKGLLEKNLSNAAIYEFAEQSCHCICDAEELPWDSNLEKLWKYVSDGSVAFECADGNEFAAFQQGRIFAMLELLKLAQQDQAGEKTLEDDAKEYCKHWRPVFAALKSGESMTHSALAAACNLSDSALSQFLHRIEDKKYIQFRKVGRTKYYRLSSRGQKLLRHMPPKEGVSLRLRQHSYILKELDFEQETSFENFINTNLYSAWTKKSTFKEHDDIAYYGTKGQMQDVYAVL